MNFVFAAAFILFPALVIWLAAKNRIVKNIGIVLVCYMAGMIVGNIGILPESFQGVQSTMQDVSVALALPLLLFSLDVKKWFRIAKSGLVCMLLAIVAIVITTFVLQLTLGQRMQDGWKLAGMASAVYTGGTPNLAAMKTALQVDNDLYILFNTYDTVFSLIYIFFMTSVARFFFQKVFKLRPYKVSDKDYEMQASDISDEAVETYGKLLNAAVIKRLAVALLISAVMLAVSFVLGGLFPRNSGTAIMILLITSLGIAGSFIKPIRNIKHTFQLGMYIIYVFCFTVASMTRLDVLININWNVLLYVLISIFGSMLLHALLSKVFRIDSDTMIITSTSAICSPPFVPVVASGLKNKNIMISGLVTGIIGYAVGNYLGVSIAMLYKYLF